MPDEQIPPIPISGLRESEKTKIREFFGYDVEVPLLPAEITPELYGYWVKIGFELHYLPAEELNEEKSLPGWKKKPGARYMSNTEIGIEFFDEIKKGNLAPGSSKLPGAWILTDARRKPQYEDGKQMYENDPLSQAMKDLRKRGLIIRNKNSDSRFNISWDELHRKEVVDTIAETLRVPSESLRLPRTIEWNYLGNVHHPEWGETNTWEWFDDAYYEGLRRLGGGGGPEYGGISSVFCGDPETARNRIGFRPLVVFPSKIN